LYALHPDVLNEDRYCKFEGGGSSDVGGGSSDVVDEGG
jgi:hypothetical protein